MSHADEGTIHAYLDGELAAGERAGLEAHLAGCAACRTRLAEERDLVERAQGLLARTAPPVAAVPPMQRKGGGGRGARPLPRWVPLAWAASVLLALGGGWMARGGMRSGGPEAPGAIALDRVESGRSGDSGVRGDAPADVALGERDAAGPAGPAGAPTTDVTRGGRAAEAKATAEEERAAAPAAQAAAPRAEAVGLAASAVANADERMTLTPVTIDSARAILGAAPVTIPGVPVRRIALGGPGIVVVEQALDATTVVQLYERRADAVREVGQDAVARQRAAAEPPRPGESSERLARYVGALRIEIAGPVGADSLSRLLERVR